MTAAPVQVRSRYDEDVAACLSVLRDVQGRDAYPSEVGDLRSFLVSSSETAAWVAVVGGRVVGHVALHQPATSRTVEVARAVTARPFDQHAVVSRLFVAPEARGQGIARELLRTALSQARAERLEAVLDVDQGFAAAVALYESEGWSRVAGDRQAVDGQVFDVWVYTGPEAPG